MDSVQEMKAHEKTYGGFISLLKWSLPPILILTLIVILVIS